jgi:hypothetical protein
MRKSYFMIQNVHAGSSHGLVGFGQSGALDPFAERPVNRRRSSGRSSEHQ